jgi:DNA-binding transcriptional MerR regulator
MNTFSIRDIENLSGIKAHTLRVWEQRYGIIKPSRKQSRHRLYGIDDLKRILRISHLYNQGFKISRIAEMSDEDICRLTAEAQSKGKFDIFINQLIEASIDFDEELFRRALDAVLFRQGFEHTIIQVVYPFLNKIGMLWLTGNIIPSQEHFASNIIRNKILFETAGMEWKPKKAGVRYVLFCPPEEYHEIPLLFIQYCLKKRGIGCSLLGVNTTLSELNDFLSTTSVTHLFVHLTTNFTDNEPAELVEDLCKLYPDIQVLASGRVFNGLTHELENLTLFMDILDFLVSLDNPSA